MPKTKYDEPVLTYQSLVDLLRERGMEIRDEDNAISNIRRIGYHRLKTYWWLFEEDHDSHILRRGTSFDDILNIYNFDQRLRTLLMDAIALIEVSVRAEWSYQMGIVGGAYAYCEKELARNCQKWQEDLDKLKSDAQRTPEETTLYFHNKYQNELPPIWVACEIMSFGQLSHWYRNLGCREIRRHISEAYGVYDNMLESWLHHLSVIRNICAHHGRLWHRNFKVASPKKHNHMPSVLNCALTDQSQIYNTLLVLLYLTDVLKHPDWRDRLREALQEQTDEFLVGGGFPADWRERSIWRAA